METRCNLCPKQHKVSNVQLSRTTACANNIREENQNGMYQLGYTVETHSSSLGKSQASFHNTMVYIVNARGSRAESHLTVSWEVAVTLP